MDWIKPILSGLSAILLSLLLPTIGAIPMVIKAIGQEHATGFALNVRGFSERTSSPRFWIFAVLFFVLFFAASRIGNKVLMVLLFCVPAILVATFGLVLLSLFVFVFV